jgi:hypothetical protein
MCRETVRDRREPAQTQSESGTGVQFGPILGELFLDEIHLTKGNEGTDQNEAHLDRCRSPRPLFEITNCDFKLATYSWAA